MIRQAANAFNAKMSMAWQRFTIAIDKHKWITYSTFALILIVFILLLPRACNYP